MTIFDDESRWDARPHAREGDPETSHQAAASVRDLRPRQTAVLHILRTFGNLTDEGIAHNYPLVRGLPRQSPSGLRTRRRELVDAGLVEDSGERGKTTAGRQTIIWRAVEAER